MLEKLKLVENRFEEINELMIQPDIISDQKRYIQISKEYKEIKKIIEKGKLGPGQIIAIDLKKGKLFKDKEIKDFLAKDYKKYNKQIIDLEKKFLSKD